MTKGLQPGTRLEVGKKSMPSMTQRTSAPAEDFLTWEATQSQLLATPKAPEWDLGFTPRQNNQTCTCTHEHKLSYLKVFENFGQKVVDDSLHHIFPVEGESGRFFVRVPPPAEDVAGAIRHKDLVTAPQPWVLLLATAPDVARQVLHHVLVLGAPVSLRTSVSTAMFAGGCVEASATTLEVNQHCLINSGRIHWQIVAEGGQVGDNFENLISKATNPISKYHLKTKWNLADDPSLQTACG